MNDARDDELWKKLDEAMGPDHDREPPADRVAQVREAAARMGARESDATAPGEVVPLRRSGRRFLLAGGIAAGIGGVAGFALRDQVLDGDGSELAGPEVPVEPIMFSARPGVSGVATDARLINHTWGVELLLDVSGLEVGTAYEVDYRLRRGGSVAAGSLLAVEELMVCRFNAAVLRADLAEIVLRARGDAPVLSAKLA